MRFRFKPVIQNRLGGKWYFQMNYASDKLGEEGPNTIFLNCSSFEDAKEKAEMFEELLEIETKEFVKEYEETDLEIKRLTKLNFERLNKMRPEILNIIKTRYEEIFI